MRLVRPQVTLDEWLGNVHEGVVTAIGSTMDLEAGLAAIKRAAAEPGASRSSGAPYEDDESDVDLDTSGPLVRPYALTAGRTRARVKVAIESLIVTIQEVTAADRGRDWQRIAWLCNAPHSLAEVAARLHVPLGVARVIVGDMAEQGVVEIHNTALTYDDEGTMQLGRVLRGLRRLA